MNLSIVIIGDEILLGRVTDTNSGLIARTFAAEGWTVKCVRTVGDNAEDIRRAIELSMAESELTLTTGGLGPTRDDITKAVMLEIFGGEMIFDESVRANVENIFKDRKIRLNELTIGQANVPSSCRVIQNRLGTAPIMWFEKDGRVLAAMPGVPYETRGMLGDVAAAVRERFGSGGLILHREYTVTGISESALAERLAGFEDSLPAGVHLAYLPDPGEIVLRLDGDFTANPAGAEAFEGLCERLKEELGENLVSEGKMSPSALVIHSLRRHRYTIATAESCTGGNIAHLITANAGCSDVMLGGVVSYSNDVKMQALGVRRSSLEAYGAVSQAVAGEMAEGVRKLTGADCAVATTGIAGPGGGSEEKPVGTVWIAAATPSCTEVQCFHFGGDRQAVIDRASAQALIMLNSLL